MKKRDPIYFCRYLPTSEVCDVYDCKVRTVADSWFTIIEKREKHVFLLNMEDIGNIVFFNRAQAVSKAKTLEKIQSKN